MSITNPKGIEIGDVVQYIEGWSDRSYYKVEYIEMNLAYAGGYSVKLKGNKSTICIDIIEPVKVKSTKLAKKIYPNWEEKNGWLYPKVY